MEILNRRLTTAFGPLLILASLGAPSRALVAGAIQLIPNGAVDVRAGANGKWRMVTAEETVSAGQEIRTHKDGSAQLVFSDGSRVLMNNYSVFAIDKTDTKEQSFSLKLGKIRAAFAGLLSSRISIHTPTAVCAVRGTVFNLEADARSTQVTMAEGVLEVKDNNGKQAVVNSEESVKIGQNGLETPHMVPLNGPDALQAVRPYGVHQEMARDATRHMLEDIRNRELKATEAQLGKDVVDAFGRRVRLEEYLLRPDTKSFEILFLSHRETRFDWGHFIQTFHAPIPDDLSRIPAIVAAGINAAAQPTNWLKSYEFFATNTVDAEKEKILFGDPTQINFAGYNGGIAKLLWYPSSIDFTQTLIGPGVPGGVRDQFVQHQDFNSTTPGLFTWTQNIVNNLGVLSPLDKFQLDPTSLGDVTATGCSLVGETCFDNSPLASNAFGGNGLPMFAGFTTVGPNFPSGPSKADLFAQTTYPDGSTVGVEKFLVSNDGKILDFNNPNSDIFNNEGTYNLEINIKSSLFQGRDIDVLVAPEILRQKKQDTTTPDQPSFKP